VPKKNLLEEDDLPLQGLLADKVVRELHSLVEKQLSSGTAPSSPETEASFEENGLDNPLESIRVFKHVPTGTPVLLRGFATAASEFPQPSWVSVLNGRPGDDSSDEERAAVAASAVAVDAAEIVERAQRLAEAAAANVCPVSEVDSDTDWRGGVKPGSTIENTHTRKRAHKCGAPAPNALSLHDNGPINLRVSEKENSSSRKRKGKKERERERRIKDCAPVESGEGNGVCQNGSKQEEEARLARKRAKRREIKKRKKANCVSGSYFCP